MVRLEEHPQRRAPVSHNYGHNTLENAQGNDF
jgi:hypothetical protein